MTDGFTHNEAQAHDKVVGGWDLPISQAKPAKGGEDLKANV